MTLLHFLALYIAVLLNRAHLFLKHLGPRGTNGEQRAVYSIFAGTSPVTNCLAETLDCMLMMNTLFLLKQQFNKLLLSICYLHNFFVFSLILIYTNRWMVNKSSNIVKLSIRIKKNLVQQKEILVLDFGLSYVMFVYRHYLLPTLTQKNMFLKINCGQICLIVDRWWE